MNNSTDITFITENYPPDRISDLFPLSYDSASKKLVLMWIATGDEADQGTGKHFDKSLNSSYTLSEQYSYVGKVGRIFDIQCQISI